MNRGRGGLIFGEGDRLITNRSQKKCFKPSYIAVLSKILFEFDRFFKLPNFVRSRILFNTCWGWEGGMYFFCFLQVDEPINGIGGWGLIISRGEL